MTRVSRGGYSRDHGDPGNQRPTLEGMSSDWQTPGTDSFRSRGGDRVDEMGLDQQARAGAWPTPRFGGAGAPDNTRTPGTGGKILAQKAQNWPTPRAEDSESAGNHPKATDSLTGATKDWATPVASDSQGEMHQSAAARAKGFAPRLQDQAREMQWSTPNVPNRGPETRASKQKRGSGGEDLQTQTQDWATPRAAEWKESGPEGSKSHQHRLDRRYLDAQAISFRPSHPDQPTEMPGEPSSSSAPTSRPRLNPAFVCWLMGWPWFWTRAEPTSFAARETESWRTRLQLHLCCLLGEPAWLSEVQEAGSRKQEAG